MKKELHKAKLLVVTTYNDTAVLTLERTDFVRLNDLLQQPESKGPVMQVRGIQGNDITVTKKSDSGNFNMHDFEVGEDIYLVGSVATDNINIGRVIKPKITEQTGDNINHPKHYGGEDNLYEAIKVIEAWGLDFNLGNVVKYVSRANKKDSEIEDLKKAKWYLERKINQLNP